MLLNFEKADFVIAIMQSCSWSHTHTYSIIVLRDWMLPRHLKEEIWIFDLHWKKNFPFFLDYHAFSLLTIIQSKSLAVPCSRFPWQLYIQNPLKVFRRFCQQNCRSAYRIFVTLCPKNCTSTFSPLSSSNFLYKSVHCNSWRDVGTTHNIAELLWFFNNLRSFYRSCWDLQTDRCAWLYQNLSCNW